MKSVIYPVLLIIAAVGFGCQNKKKVDEKPGAEQKTLSKKSAEQYNREFQLSLRNGDTTEAIKVLERFQRVDSTDVAAKGALITLQMQSRQISRVQGLSKLHQLFERTASPAVEQMYLSAIMYNGTPEEVIAGLDTLIAHYPDRAIFHVRRAYTLMEMERFDEAIESFTNAIKLQPDNLYLTADRTLARYRKGETKAACMAWKTPGGGSQSYYEQYCKWSEFETLWSDFIRNPGQATAGPVEEVLLRHHESLDPPDEKLRTHVLDSWRKLSRKTSGNQTLLDIGFQCLKIMKDAQHYELRCELAKSITASPKAFLIAVKSNRHHFKDLNEIVGALDKELIHDKDRQIKEVEKRIVSINSVNTPELIKTRSESLLALEKKRERLMRP
jgi:tetratricopeptide (TPR) repeat protein